ncbi:MAG: urease accessory protein UreF [Rhizobiaceae bacterium MnEN-MB40S]|nr:MAG: urease accessory protein UreF [Rhizobiaceae bacterium MnEN-MB40S]
MATVMATTAITTVTTMTDQRSLLRLMSWMSPAFPTGAFTYSQGLEGAVHDGLISDGDALRRWLEDSLAFGQPWNDAVLFAESWRRARAGEDCLDVAELAEAMAGSAGRHVETMGQGSAFLKAAREWPSPVLNALPTGCPLPVAAGAASGAHGIDLSAALAAFLHATVSNAVQASLRLLPLGQQQGVAIMAALEDPVTETVEHAMNSTLDDLGGAAFLAEIMSMRHETQYSRLFRS